MSDLAIKVNNLGKQYRIGVPVNQYRTLRDTLSESLTPHWRKNSDSHNTGESFWALRNVSFNVRQGQVLGIIGRNGAGKSTLLKILSRVTEPSEGTAEILGRVGSLLEVGTGFHPELTGRENIYLNGAILGMSRLEIDRKLDEIIDFSEVEKFIDTPIKRYSSGMYLRLAFSVAAHLEPEILVVDEVLAVGDAEFQRKCMGKMSDVALEGRTVLFVSHNMSAILRLTEETLVIEKGSLVLREKTPAAIDYYLSRGLSQEGQYAWTEAEISNAVPPFRPIGVRILNKKNEVCDTIRSTEPALLEIEYSVDEPITGLRLGFYLMTTRGEYVFTSFDTDELKQFEAYSVRPAGHYISRCEFPANLLNEGRFVIGVNASSYRVKRYFQDDQALTFNVDAAGAAGMQWPEARLGPIRPQLNWEIEER